MDCESTTRGSIPVVRPSINGPFVSEIEDKPRKHFSRKSSRGFQTHPSNWYPIEESIDSRRLLAESKNGMADHEFYDLDGRTTPKAANSALGADPTLTGRDSRAALGADPSRDLVSYKRRHSYAFRGFPLRAAAEVTRISPGSRSISINTLPVGARSLGYVWCFFHQSSQIYVVYQQYYGFEGHPLQKDLPAEWICGKILVSESCLEGYALILPRTLLDFFSEKRDATDKNPEWGPVEKRRKEIEFVEQVKLDLAARGARVSLYQRDFGVRVKSGDLRRKGSSTGVKS
ncbi:hypothetical protein RND71_015916 [Anisodus tanguticus]|uniref:Uncharacterized protein n=1 Tax=Anisodus tanguticus TaxID=243964 RepID=A0AAE1S6G8_9SOLA|nr:hypothetical protein RND71_015916 [Anisodus tanguticus]